MVISAASTDSLVGRASSSKVGVAPTGGSGAGGAENSGAGVSSGCGESARTREKVSLGEATSNLLVSLVMLSTAAAELSALVSISSFVPELSETAGCSGSGVVDEAAGLSSSANGALLGDRGATTSSGFSYCCSLPLVASSFGDVSGSSTNSSSSLNATIVDFSSCF